MTDPIVLQATGDVKGPASSTDNSMVLFSGTSGKLIKGNNAVVTAAGLALLDDNNNTEQRNTLGLGSIATQNSNAITITGGNITGLTQLKCTGTDNSVPTAPAGDKSNKIANTEFVMANGVPVGAIVMWSDATIPDGWKLCNGVGTLSNGKPVPNLTDKFVLGAGNSYALGSTGGSKDAVVVSHTHTANSSVTDPGHTHVGACNSGGGGSFGIDSWDNNNIPQPAFTGISVNTTISNAGISGVNANMPPYYSLYFIIKN